MLVCQNITKFYRELEVLKSANLIVNKGDFLGIMGPSGSGKTTLLNIIATIDSPTTGTVTLSNKQPHTFSPELLAHFRRRELGMVFQDYNLVPTLTIEENIMLPLTLDGVSLKEMRIRLHRVAKELGIKKILKKRISEVSGGQAQRAAIARAVIHKPQFLLADEPTGNLDSKASRDVMRLLKKMNEVHGITIILVTHDAKDASYCNKVAFMQDGQLDDIIPKTDTQNLFYQNIIQKLSYLEGTSNEF